MPYALIRIIRKGLVDEAIQKWGLMDVQVFDISTDKSEVVLDCGAGVGSVMTGRDLNEP